MHTLYPYNKMILRNHDKFSSDNFIDCSSEKFQDFMGDLH